MQGLLPKSQHIFICTPGHLNICVHPRDIQSKKHVQLHERIILLPLTFGCTVSHSEIEVYSQNSLWKQPDT